MEKSQRNFHYHECRQYHIRACEAAQNFMSVFEKCQDDIVTQINAGKKIQVEENRKKLIPIIKTVLFCGMEGLPLRGHESDLILEIVKVMLANLELLSNLEWMLEMKY